MSEGRQPPNNPQTAAHAISSEIGDFVQLVPRTGCAIQCWRRKKMMVSKP
jgi:hypothetical protein